MPYHSDPPEREDIRSFDPEQRQRQMRERVEALLMRRDLDVVHEDAPYVRELAGFLSSLEGWDSFESLAKRLREPVTDNAVSADQLKAALKNLKAAVKRVVQQRQRAEERMRAANASIMSIDDMLDSEAPFLVCLGLLRKHLTGRIWFDRFKVRVMTNWSCTNDMQIVDPQEITDANMLRIRTWLMSQRVDVLGGINQKTAEEAVAHLAYDDERDSLKDHVESLPEWDQVPRLSTWMVEGMGCEVNDEVGQTANYIKATGKNLLIGMIARALKPGSKVDMMPIFYGPQGALKSTAMNVLATDEFFSEISETPTHKDFYIALEGVWLGEVAELASIASSRVETARVKGMVSRRIDRYRPPYAKASQDFPRRIQMVGTTNEQSFMRDETGNRRYPTVRVGRIDIEWLKANRTQLLAEALREYRAGATWWEMPMEDHARVVEAYQTTSAFHDIVAERLLDANLYDGTSMMVGGGPAGIAEDVAVPVGDEASAAERWGNVVTVMRVGVRWLGLTVAEAERLNRTIAATLRQLGWVQANPKLRTTSGRRKDQRCWVVADKAARVAQRAAGELVGVVTPEDQLPF